MKLIQTQKICHPPDKQINCEMVNRENLQKVMYADFSIN
jgi:hypothetical protein